MSTPGSPVCAPDWLALREPADAAARSLELAELAVTHLPRTRPLVVRDLGCGSGSMGRWLAPRLPGAQTWVLHDRDADLLAIAAAGLPDAAADGAPVTARTAPGDLTELSAADLRAPRREGIGAPRREGVTATSLITASALLDLLTLDEVDDLAAACVAAGCPALLTLSVTGRARLHPAEPLDAEFASAFDAHQRRPVGSRRGGERRLLGPDAAAVAVAAFDRRGATVLTRPSPWHLDASTTPLLEEWLRGWIAAACAHRPALEEYATDYLRHRLDACAAGRLRVTVGHLDVLALPAAATTPPGELS